MPTYNCLSAADYRFAASRVANEIESGMKRWEHWAEQLNVVPTKDTAELGLTADEQAQMGSMRTDVLALIAWYRANAQTFVKRHAQLHIIG